MFEQVELVEPREAVEEAGADVELVSLAWPPTSSRAAGEYEGDPAAIDRDGVRARASRMRAAEP